MQILYLSPHLDNAKKLWYIKRRKEKKEIFPYGVAVAQEALTLQVLVRLRSGGAMGIGVMVARLTLNQEESVRNRHPLPIKKFLEVLRMRSRAWRRYKNYTKAKRKREIDLYSIWWYPHYPSSLNSLDFSTGRGMYHNLHQYSKNKIHCSCPMCSAKTRNKGKHRKTKPCSPSINYKRVDLRRQQSMDADIESYNEN